MTQDEDGRLPPLATPGSRGSALEPLAASQPEALIPSAVWTGSKQQRDALREKFGGRCAYCGAVLDKMHADHFEPCIRVTRDGWGGMLAKPYMVKPERNIVANMMPACAACNLHKGGYNLESWRDIIQRSAEIIRKQTSTFKAGERFGVITVSGEPVLFYFETLLNSTKCKCADPDGGGPIFPMYGVAPHDCYWRKGPQFSIGQSTLRKIEDDDCFVPDLNDGETWADFVYPSACGTFYCPQCQQEKYAAAWSALVERIGTPPAVLAAQRIETRQGQDPEGLGAQPESLVASAMRPGCSRQRESPSTSPTTPP